MEANFFLKHCNTNTNFCIQIALLNARSLHKHALDILNDPTVIISNLICITETQLLDDSLLPSLQSAFPNHFLSLSNNIDKFCSLATLHDPMLDLLHQQSFSGLYFVNFFVTRLSKSIKVLIVYKKNSQPLHNFIELMSYVVRTVNPDIILGDFNLNLLSDENQTIVNILTTLRFKQIVSGPTHVLGSLIDHVYISEPFSSIVTVSVHIHSLYYSDHDAIILQLV